MFAGKQWCNQIQLSVTLDMPIYFQKISEKRFKADGEFLVKDSKGCNMVVGLLFLATFATTVYIDRFDTANPSVYQLLYLSVLPGLYLLKRAFVNKTLMAINRTGFYYLGELVTNWKNFIDAVVKQDEENRKWPYDLTDRFMLMIRYYKDDEPGYFARKFLMTAVMDKSEEEIMAAIKFYYNHSSNQSDIRQESFSTPQLSG
jgi:hypothetical protein